MFTIFNLAGMFLPIVLLVVVVMAGMCIFALFLKSKGGEEITEEEPNLYEKKPFVFDVMSELDVYRQLVTIFGDTYYIFPQVSYGRLIQLKKGVELRHRTKFDKKVADFVLCDKTRAVAQLVVELDGSSHETEKKIDRDKKVDAMMQQIGLPILHLKPGIDDLALKNAVLNKLSNLPATK